MGKSQARGSILMRLLHTVLQFKVEFAVAKAGKKSKVYEGERSLTKDCHELGKFDLTGIPPAPRGVPQIEVTFEVDANGILHVRAEDKAAKKSQSITITNDKGHLSQEEIERMVKEAEEFAKEDNKVREKIDSDDKKKIESTLKEELECLDDNQKAEKDDFDEKLKEVEAVVNVRV